MNHIRNRIRVNFTVTPNELINDRDIDPKARFLFIYMAAKPDDHDFIITEIAAELGWHPDTCRKYLEALMRRGWVTRTAKRTPDGRFTSFDYDLLPYRLPDTSAQTGEAAPHRKKTDAVKNGGRKNRHNIIINNSLPAAEPVLETTPGDVTAAAAWLNGGADRLAKAAALLLQTFEASPDLPRLVCEEARVKITREQFDEEVDEWLRYNCDNYPIMANPVRFLRAGRGSLHSWLKKPFRNTGEEKKQGQQHPPVYKRNGSEQGAAPVVYDRPAKGLTTGGKSPADIVAEKKKI